MPGGVGGAERAARVAGRRLHPQVAKGAVAQHLAVGHAVERHAAGHAQVGNGVFGRQRPGHAQHRLLGHRLDRGGQVHVELLERLLVGAARRPAEQLGEAAVGHGQPGGVVEIALVEPVGAVRLEVHQRVEDQVLEARLTVGREPHDLVLAAVDPEARVIGEGRVEQPQRMGKAQLLDHLERRAPADGDRRRRPFPDPVQRQHQRLVEGRGIEGAGRVAVVMPGEQQPVRRVEGRIDALELPGHQVLLEQLLADPDRHRHAEGPEAARRVGHVGLQQPLELQERLVVEGDMVHLVQPDAGLVEHAAHRVRGEARVVLLAGEPLLLRGGDRLSVHEKRGRAVMVIGRQAQDRRHLRTTCR